MKIKMESEWLDSAISNEHFFSSEFSIVGLVPKERSKTTNQWVLPL